MSRQTNDSAAPNGRAKWSRPGSLLVALLSVALSACDSSGPVACTAEFVYGIEITALDAETDAAVSDGLSGVAIRASTSSAMEVVGNTLLGAGEQAGNYAVVVSASGYEVLTRTDIEVTEDECHVRTVHLTARLVLSS